jgi:RHS repeat-associated protein
MAFSFAIGLEILYIRYGTMKPQHPSISYSPSSNYFLIGAVSLAENIYGQSVYDILLTKFLDKSNYYVDSINLTEWHMYGSSRLGIYSTTLNLAWQRFQASVTNGQYANITNTVLVVNEPSYNFFYLVRGNKRYELSNHLGNVLAVISDMKLFACHQYDKFVNFEDNPNIQGDWNIRDSWEAQNAVITLANGKLNVVEQITSDPHARVNYLTATHLPPGQTYKISFDLEQIHGDPNWQVGIVTSNSATTYEANFTFFSASPGHNEITVHPSKHIWRIRLLHLQTAQDIEFNIDNFRIENLSLDTFTSQMADVVSATDYSPFGAPLPGRTLVTKEYRFRFNGKENDSETYGDGNALDFGARIYDSRLGRWMSVDEIMNPSYSSYTFCRNSPVILIDIDGRSDYYSPSGVYLGSDGTEGTDIFIITDKKVENQIYNQNKNALINHPNEYVIAKINLKEGTYFKLPSYEDRQEINSKIEEVDYSLGRYYEIAGSRFINNETKESETYFEIGDSKSIEEIGKEYENTPENEKKNFSPLTSYVGGNSDAKGYEYTWHIHTNKVFLIRNIDGKWQEKPNFEESVSITLGANSTYIGGYELSTNDETLTKYSKTNFLFTPKGDKVLFFGSEKNIFLSKGFFFETKAKTKPEEINSK